MNDVGRKPAKPRTQPYTRAEFLRAMGNLYDQQHRAKRRDNQVLILEWLDGELSDCHEPKKLKASVFEDYR